MAIKILYDAATGKFKQNINSIYAPMAQAATSAVRDVGRATQRAVKANLSGGGFPSRWQASVKAAYRPKSGPPSIDASVHIYSTINFLGVFEQGSRIGGKPFLWLPLPDIPQKFGGKPMRPDVFIRNFGPLISARHSSTPILLGQIAIGARGTIGKKTIRKFNLSKVSARTAWVPVFIGVSAVKLRRRLNYSAILRGAQQVLPEKYEEYLAKLTR